MSTKIIYTLVFGLLLFLGTAQGQEWTRIIDAPPTSNNINTYMLGQDVHPSSDGGYLMLGLEQQPVAQYRQLPVLTKVNAQGYIQWERRYFADLMLSGHLEDAALLVGAGDTAIIAGIEQSSQLLILQVNPQGDTIWRQSLLNNCGCTLDKISMLLLPTGEYLLAIATSNIAPGGGIQETILLQLNRAGVVVQQQTQTGFWAEDIRHTFDGGYILSGYYNNSPGLQKITASWSTTWTESYAGMPTSSLHSVAQAPDSGYVVATELQGFVGSTPRLFKVDATGQTIEWTLDTLSSTVGIGLTGLSQHVIRTAAGNLLYVSDLNDRRPVMPVFDFRTVVTEVSPTGQIIDYTLLDPGPGLSTRGKRIREAAPQEFILVGSYTSRGYLVKFGNAGAALQELSGYFYVDTNANCALDFTETKLKNWVLRAEEQNTGQVYYTTTNQSGAYNISLPTGQYLVEGIAPNGVWSPCMVNVTTGATVGGKDTLNFGFETPYDCPQLTVDVSTPYLAACDTVVYQVTYCNNGSALAMQPRITLQIDSVMTWLGANVPFTALATAGTYQVNRGNLAPGQCATFEFTVSLACQAPVTQLYCVQADIEPDSLCGALVLNWDGSDIEVRGTCTSDSIIYWLYNIGTGAMSTSRTYLVTEDHIMLRTGNYQLGVGDSVRIVIPIRNNATYHVRVNQDPQHPYRSYASVGATDCIMSGLSTNTAASFAQYPEDDGAPTRSIDCQGLLGNDSSSYKRAAPVGFGIQHFIEREVDLEYQLRFQNTTGSTIRQVTLIDTLSNALDPSRLVMGASSQSYVWSLTGTGVLTVQMRNMNLEAGAWGFVKFKIAQQRGLPLGTVIYNSASISLGGALLQGTNSTFHTIDEDFIPTSINQIARHDLEWSVYPNPFNAVVTFALKKGTVASFEVSIMDALGREVGRVYSATGAPLQWQSATLPTGVYLYQIRVEDALVGTGKLVAAPQ